MAKKVGGLFYTLGLDASKFSKALGQAQKGLQNFGKNVQQIGRELSMSFTLPLAAIGGASAKMAMDFETSLAKIEGLVGVAKEDVAAMGAEARKMAVEMGKGANEAAEALFYITSAGLRGKEAMEVLNQSMKASAVGLGSTATVADLATSAVNAYGSATLSAAEATDVMVAAVREGKLEAGELAGSMGRVLPMASKLGISFNEVGAAFAALSRTGTGAAEAATQIRGIMATLLKPSTDAQKALADMGISADFLRQNIKDKGLLDTLEILAQKFEGNDEAAARVFGNIRALSGIYDLLGANVDSTRAIFANMVDVAGDTDKAFGVVAETAQSKLNRAIAEAKEGMLELGQTVIQALLPFIEKLGTAIRGASEWFKGLDDSTKRMVVGFAAIVAAAGPLLIIIGQMAISVSALTKLWALLNITMMANPIILAGAAIVAAGVGIAYAIKAIRGETEQMVKVKLPEYLDNIRTASEALLPIYQKLNTAKKTGAQVTQEEKDAIMDNLVAKRAEVTTNKELLQGLLAVSKARYAQLQEMARGTGLTAEQRREMRLLRGSIKEYEAAINDARHAEVEIGGAIKDANDLMVKKSVALKALNKDWNATGKTVEQIQQRINDLGEALKNTIPQSEEFYRILAQIKSLKELINPKDMGFQELQEVVDLSEGIANKFEELPKSLAKAANYTPYLSSLTKEFERLDNIAKSLGHTSDELAKDKLRAVEQAIIQMIDAGRMGTQEFAALLEIQNRLSESLAKTQADTESVIPVFQALGQAVGASMQGATNSWLQFGVVVSQGILQMIVAAKKAIAAAKAVAIAKAVEGGSSAGAATGPLAPFATPAFIAQLIGVVGSAIAAIPKFAKGGAVTGPTLAMIGENPASRGEAIIPFEKIPRIFEEMSGMVGGMQRVVVTGQIAGDVIRLSNDSSNQRNANVRWSRGTALVT